MFTRKIDGTARIAIALGAAWIVVLCAAAVWPEVVPKLSSLFVLDFRTLDDPPKQEAQILWRRFAPIALGPLALMTILVFTLQWIQRGFVNPNSVPYTVQRRLQDVIALIQILALHEHSHRSEEGLESGAKGKPNSAKSWLELAKEHPEFFRLDATANYGASLVARHALPDNALESDRAKLAADLIRIAIDLHDRQERSAQRWHAFVPIFSAVATAVVAVAGLVLHK